MLVGYRDSVAGLHRTLSAARGGLAYEFAGAVGDDSPRGVRQLGSLDRLGAILAETRPHELILSEGDFDEETVLDLVEAAHRAGVKVRLAPKTTELLVQRGEFVPGRGAPLFELRPPVLAGADIGAALLDPPGRSLLATGILAANLYACLGDACPASTVWTLEPPDLPAGDPDDGFILLVAGGTWSPPSDDRWPRDLVVLRVRAYDQPCPWSSSFCDDALLVEAWIPAP